jgi:hypothetical protein
MFQHSIEHQQGACTERKYWELKQIPRTAHNQDVSTSVRTSMQPEIVAK